MEVTARIETMDKKGNKTFKDFVLEMKPKDVADANIVMDEMQHNGGRWRWKLFTRR